ARRRRDLAGPGWRSRGRDRERLEPAARTPRLGRDARLRLGLVPRVGLAVVVRGLGEMAARPRSGPDGARSRLGADRRPIGGYRRLLARASPPPAPPARARSASAGARRRP